MGKDIVVVCSLILHQMIRLSIKQFGYVESMRRIAMDFMPLYITNKQKYVIRLSRKKIENIVEYISQADCDGDIVSSCISISALVHILCYMGGIQSKIIIGVAWVNEKVFSHAWIELDDGTIIGKPYDEYVYKPIKTFSFDELYYDSIYVNF